MSPSPSAAEAPAPGSGAADSPPPLVELYEAEKRYDGRTVLRIDRLELHAGDWLAITGSNGSGKSTLLRVLAGVSMLSSGRLVRSSDYERLRICFIPQSGGLHAHLTLADNLRMWQRLIGSGAPSDLVSQSYVERFGLERFLGTKCSDLSGGFQRLAALACALSTRPDGLLLDEPLSGIDGPHAEALVGGLADALERLRFMVVTSHFADDVAAANRVVDLTAGVAR